MKTKHLIKFYTALVVVSVLLAACGGAATEAPGLATESLLPTEAPPAGEEQTISVWGFVWTADWLDAIVPQFEAENPGVKVKVERFE